MSKQVNDATPFYTGMTAEQLKAKKREVLKDGPMTVTVEWSDDDDAFIALIWDAEGLHRKSIVSVAGFGASREEALAHLALALHNALLGELEHD
jgi:hypothetical protein